MDSGTVQWSNLPKELLEIIAKRLDTRADILRLRAVCSPWRSALTPLPIHSLSLSVKIPFPIAPNPALHPKRRGYFSLIESTLHYLQPLHKASSSSSKGWLVKVREEESEKMRLMDPLSKVIFNLPPDSLPKVLNLLNFRVSEIKKVYNLQFVDLHKYPYTSINELKSLDPKRVAVSSSSVGTGADDYTIMTIHTGGKLAYLKLGDNKWTAFDDGQQKTHYDDVVYHKGKFYAVDMKGRVLVIDSSLKFREIGSPARRVGIQYGGQYKRLVESFGDLFLIDRFTDADIEYYHSEEDEEFVPEDYNHDYPIRFKVYKLNDEENEWVRVKTLGNRAFFLGDDYSFSVSARDFPGCKENCIYFMEVSFTQEEDDHPGCETGMFDLEDGTVGPLSDFPGYSQIFWPPPTWLRPKPSGSGASQWSGLPKGWLRPKPKPGASSGASQWSNLPKGLLAIIAKSLDSRTDILCLRAVCSPWRSSITPVPLHSPPSSIKLPFPISPNAALHRKRRGYFSLTESTIYYLEPLHKNPNASTSSSKGWLVRVGEEKTGKMRLLDPLAKDITVVPPKSFPKVLNLLNFRVFEVKKEYDLQFVDLRKNPPVSPHELKSLIILKVAVSSSPGGTGAADGYAVMAVHTCGKLGYLKLGDNKWTAVDDGHENPGYDDVVYHKGQFYAVDFKGRVLVIDSLLKFRETVCPVLRRGRQYGGQFKHLVESSGDLFSVDRFIDKDLEIYYDEEVGDYVSKAYKPNCSIHFMVYKLKDEKEWVPVKSLGDRAFIVGDDCSFSVSARDFLGCKKNCIYFGEKYYDEPILFFNQERYHPGYFAGMFDLEDGTVGPLSSFPGYSQIFWPPPTWLKPKPSSSRY